MKDVTNIPLSYYGVDEDSYAYKLGIMIQFMQHHIRLITDNPELISQNVFKHYNDNMGDLKDKVLYLDEEEVEKDIASEAKIRSVYPGKVKLVDKSEIKKVIMSGDEDAVFLHKVGPEGSRLDARVYKILIGAGDSRFYYFDYHKLSRKQPDAILESDFKKLARAR
jgi:hypothetical protein